MPYHYSNPRRANDPYALPDIETFYADGELLVNEHGYDRGWYYWPCLPGCLPNGDPIGPFASEEDALADAREWADEEGNEE